MKILSVTPYNNVAMFNVRAGNTTRIRPGDPAWAGWTVTVRGPLVYIVSPPGWQPGKAAEGTKRQVAQLAASQCLIEYEIDEGEKPEDLGRADVPKDKR